jgi:sugar phosphate isomerase/epimerase
MTSASRRRFLQLLTASAAVAPLSSLASARALGSAAIQAAPRLPVPGVAGLELYSVRHRMEKDMPGTLKLVRRWGFTEVEGGVFQGKTAAETRALLDEHGLRMQSSLVGYEAFAKDLDAVIADAKTLGLTFVGTAWIPHQRPFGKAHVDKALEDFTKWGKALRGAGLRLFYHVHGYEFQPSPDGTLMDTLIKHTPADAVDFQADVFWVARGGGDPVGLLKKYPGRFKLAHLKDIEKGVALNDATGTAPDETSVVLGAGQLDIPAILRAARDSGVTHYYIEDEHPDAYSQIPKTLEYLRNLKI